MVLHQGLATIHCSSAKKTLQGVAGRNISPPTVPFAVY